MNSLGLLQVMGALTAVSEIKEVADGINKLKALKEDAEALKETAEGMALLAENKGAEAKAKLVSALGSVGGAMSLHMSTSNLSQCCDSHRQLSLTCCAGSSEALAKAREIGNDITTAYNTLEALPALLEGDMNALLSTAASAAKEVAIIKEGLKVVTVLQTGIQTLQELKAQVRECATARVPSVKSLTKKEPRTVQEVNAIAAEVERLATEAAQQLGKCRRINDSIARLTK